MKDQLRRQEYISHPFIHLLTIAMIISAISCKQPAKPTPDSLAGMAEDLWGNSINLEDNSQGITFIAPFSPSNCGYCLFDGEFAESNYFKINASMGGANLHQCLFNPQLDVYSYLKHYRETTRVLTYPPRLHDYHQDGFPFLIAFRDGKKIYSYLMSPYMSTYHKVLSICWPDLQPPSVTLPSGKKMAYAFMYEDDDKKYPVLHIIPNSSKEMHGKYVESSKSNPDLLFKLEKEVTKEDLEKHLVYDGPIDLFDFAAMNGKANPIRFSATTLNIGPYSLPRNSVGVTAIFPNPFNRARYVKLNLNAPDSEEQIRGGWNDYSIWRIDPKTKKCVLLLDGKFEILDGNKWQFKESQAIVYGNIQEYCKGGACPMPPSEPMQTAKAQYPQLDDKWVDNAKQASYISLGLRECRFPSIAIKDNGAAGVTWEEKGDIIFAYLTPHKAPQYVQIESGPQDSFNPRIVWNGENYFIAYLSDKNGFYGLYGRFMDDGRISPEIMISDLGSYDVITPALVSDQSGHITVAWTEWKANYRYPKYREIIDRSLGPTKDMPVAPNDIDYTNAWSISLAADKDGKVWGTWNQHYPAILGVCGGPLTGPVTSITKVAAKVEESENGEYPSIAMDADRKPWVIWATDGWKTYQGEAQKILATHGDHAGWGVPYTLSLDSQTMLNQSPKIGVAGNGTVKAVWSGRPKKEGSQWGIYLSEYSNKRWSNPRLVSPQGICSRAPEIGIEGSGKLWVTWHEGTGERMRIKAWVED